MDDHVKGKEKVQDREFRKIIDISAGKTHSVAVDTSDVLWSWGGGCLETLKSDYIDSVDPLYGSTLDGRQIMSLNCGDDHTVAFCEADMKVYSWSCNKDGCSGRETNSDMNIPGPINFFNGVRIKQIACGGEHSLALTGEGKVVSWGGNEYGQLGLGTYDGEINIPQNIGAFERIHVKMVAAGKTHSAAVTDDGNLYSWGGGQYGNLGHGDNFDRIRPMKVSSIDGKKMQLVACGRRHTAWVTTTGALYTNGCNRKGQLGIRDRQDHLVPHLVVLTPDYHVSQISCGWYHTMAVTSEGSLYGWGSNEYGQVGNGSTKDVWYPVSIDFPGPQKAVQVCCGSNHTLAITSNDNVYSWGSGWSGQLGLGDRLDRFRPTKIQLLSKIKGLGDRIEYTMDPGASSSGLGPSEKCSG